MVILQCFQQNRTKLSRHCHRFLAEVGQLPITTIPLRTRIPRFRFQEGCVSVDADSRPILQPSSRMFIAL